MSAESLLDKVCKHCGWHATVLMLEALGAHPKKALYCSGNKKNHKHEFVPRSEYVKITKELKE